MNSKCCVQLCGFTSGTCPYDPCQLMLRSVYIILVTVCFDYYMAVVDEILLSLVSRIANSIHIADVG